MKHIMLTMLPLAFLIPSSRVYGQDHHLLLQKPTVSRTQIVFAYAGDLWTVGREGGQASRLTT